MKILIPVLFLLCGSVAQAIDFQPMTVEFDDVAVGNQEGMYQVRAYSHKNPRPFYGFTVVPGSERVSEQFDQMDRSKNYICLIKASNISAPDRPLIIYKLKNCVEAPQ